MKGKKKKLRRPKTRNPDKEVYDNGMLRAERDGKNIFFSNSMTEEQHALWIENLKAKRPEFYIDIRKRIEKLVLSINSYDKVFVLGGIAAYLTQKMIADVSDENENGAIEIILEYCQSIAMATENMHKGVKPSAENLEEIYKLLVEIKKDMLFYYAIERLETTKYTKIESDIRFEMISETLLIRGEGYMNHIEELFFEMFSSHDNFFFTHYGFTSKDIIDTFKELESSFNVRIGLTNGMPGMFFFKKLRNWEITKKVDEKYPDDFVKANPGIAVEDGNPVCYPLSWIPHYEKLFRIRFLNETHEKVTKAMAMKFGSNQIFRKYAPYEPITESEIYQLPIVRNEENYYLFSMNLGARNYFNIAQYLIKKADLDYYNQVFSGSKNSISKDRFIERKVMELFSKILPEVVLYPNVTYKYKESNVNLKCAKADNDKYELDIIGISDVATYVIEIKAGIAEKETRRGAIKSIKSDLRKIIGDAVCQSYRAYRHIISTENSFFLDEKGNEIHPINKSNIFRISVSFSYVGSIISSLNKLKEFDVIDKNAGYAWSVNILDLRAFSCLISSEQQFIDYLTKRIPMYEDRRLENLDEMDMIGLYFENDLKIDPVFDGYRSVRLNAYKDEIDRYFNYGGDKPSKKINK